MFSEKWGTTVDEAIELALEDLKLTREDVDIEVLEEPLKGFLNLRNKLAKVRVTKKGEKLEVEDIQEEKEIKKSSKKEIKEIKKEEKVKHEIKDLPILEYSKEIKDHKVKDFLTEVTNKMGLDLDIKVFATEEGNNLKVTLDGEKIGLLIGKKGQTLDSLQYLTNLHINKNKNRETEEFERVQLDANSYREKRQETLLSIADKLYEKSLKIKKNVRFEPMNAYERKIIHSFLQGKDNIKTTSEGKEPYRRVVIEYIK